MTRRSALAGMHPAAGKQGPVAPAVDDTDTHHPPIDTVETRQDTPGEIDREIDREIDHEVPQQRPEPEPEPSDHWLTWLRQTALWADVNDPAALIPSPTVLSVPGSVMRRFEDARKRAASHTALMLDALREAAERLPELVQKARPAPSRDDLFPFRSTPAAGRSPDRPEPLRVRPTVGELAIIDALVDGINAELQRTRPRTAKASRSEVVTAALDACLPAAKKRRR